MKRNLRNNNNLISRNYTFKPASYRRKCLFKSFLETGVFYVDDLFAGTHTLEEAKLFKLEWETIFKELILIWQNGGSITAILQEIQFDKSE